MVHLQPAYLQSTLLYPELSSARIPSVLGPGDVLETFWSITSSASSDENPPRITETTPLSPSYRSRLNSRTILKKGDLNSTHLSLHQDMESTSFAPRRIGSQTSRSLSQLRTRFNRRAEVSPDDLTDPAIGEVTRSGKFRCLDSSCNDLTFGRQADFKRHYDNVHASKKLEYFCPQDGCDRSRYPTGRSKGRSFKGRKDKMDEHVRTVHQRKLIEKRVPESLSDEEQNLSDLFVKTEKGKRAKTGHDGT